MRVVSRWKDFDLHDPTDRSDETIDHCLRQDVGSTARQTCHEATQVLVAVRKVCQLADGDIANSQFSCGRCVTMFSSFRSSGEKLA
jgi:hypothetical protein